MEKNRKFINNYYSIIWNTINIMFIIFFCLVNKNYFIINYLNLIVYIFPKKKYIFQASP